MQSNNYWSSSTNANNTNNAWVVNMNNGNVNNDNKDNNNNYVWPVRSGEWLPSLFSFENLYASYLKCRKNKRSTVNALKFEVNAEENLFKLSDELTDMSYQPSRSVCFIVKKPKMREIIAADFRDRIVHHLLVERLESIYEPLFIHDSYACRKNKGLHKAVERVRDFIRKGSSNCTKKLYFLHLDIRNFFMTIDKEVLYRMLEKKVGDENLRRLAHTIIFHNPAGNCLIKGDKNLVEHLPPHKSLFHAAEEKGLPVGNLTSQFFANVYLNELDQYVKHIQKCKYYVRYCDDFLILDESPERLNEARENIRGFLLERLKLTLNEKFKNVLPVSNGIDFLGYIIKQDYTLARRRVVNNLKSKLNYYEKELISKKSGMKLIKYDIDVINNLRSILASYFGHLKWADTYNLKSAIIERYDFLKEYFRFETSFSRFKLRYKFPEIFPSVKSQYLCYARSFRGMVIFFQVGCFYEFYGEMKDAVLNIMRLKRVKKNRRGNMYGFHVRLARGYIKMLIAKGLSVVLIRETDRYLGKIKERLPVVKIVREL